MSDLVVNPEDRFSHIRAQIRIAIFKKCSCSGVVISICFLDKLCHENTCFAHIKNTTQNPYDRCTFVE